MPTPFGKKKSPSTVGQLTSKLNILLDTEALSQVSEQKAVLTRSQILRSAMFWDSKERVQRIKSLVLSNMDLQVFQDLSDFRIDELMSIELLSFSRNKIIHLQPLSVLDTLVCLNISHNQVYDISSLKQLYRLQELYTSHNQISTIDSLSSLQHLRILNVFMNRISSYHDTLRVLQLLICLEELDIESNPVYEFSFRDYLLTLGLTRLNGEVVTTALREKNNQLMSSSCLLYPAKMTPRETSMSFFGSSNVNWKVPKNKQLELRLEELEERYAKIDDDFEDKISQNVEFKAEYHKRLQAAKEAESRRNQAEQRSQQITLLKRKVKSLKQTLFTKDKKGILLKRLFELQTTTFPKQVVSVKPREQFWERKFDYDDVIIIADNTKYLEEDSELASALEDNSIAIEQLKRELKSMT